MSETVAPSAAAPAIEALAHGGMAIVVDDGHPERPGALVVAAAHATAAAINELDRRSRGSAVLCLTDERCEALGLDPLTGDGSDAWWPTATIDAPGAGASAEDRARTVAIATGCSGEDVPLVRPGHVRPMRARPGGTLARSGWTEAAVDLAAAAGGPPAAVMSVILDADGAVLGGAGVAEFARRHRLPVVTIDEVVAHRWEVEPLVERVAAARLPTPAGDFLAIGFRDLATQTHHLALVKGEIRGAAGVGVSVHHRCVFGDALGGLTCDCGRRLHGALERLRGSDRGLLVYVFGDPGSQASLRCPGDGVSAEQAVAGERLARQIAGALGVRDITDDGGSGWEG